jgi:uncharacterized protein YjbJ (UPF0337 family)
VLSLRTGPKVTAYGGTSMNKDRIEGNWLQVKGKVKEKWGKLTDDDLDVIEGNTDQLVGRIQERYGVAEDEAQKQVEEWNRSRSKTYTAETDDLKGKAS